MEKEIVILAKSSKKGEYCIAGVDSYTGEWIRPVSGNQHNEGSVPLKDITYEDGSHVEILDKVKIRFLSHSPTEAQPENYVYDSSNYWTKTGRVTLNDLINNRGFDKPNKIFYNNSKEVSDHEISGQASLLFVKIHNPIIVIKSFPENRKIQLNFSYNNELYRYFYVSDNKVKELYSSLQDGKYYCGQTMPVVFSLTDKFMGKCYKMAAQMFMEIP